MKLRRKAWKIVAVVMIFVTLVTVGIAMLQASFGVSPVFFTLVAMIAIASVYVALFKTILSSKSPYLKYDKDPPKPLKLEEEGPTKEALLKAYRRE